MTTKTTFFSTKSGSTYEIKEEEDNLKVRQMHGNGTDHRKEWRVVKAYILMQGQRALFYLDNDKTLITSRVEEIY